MRRSARSRSATPGTCATPSRFNQVESVSDAERDRAWKRILAAAKRYDVNVSESDWRELAKGGKDRKR